LIFFLKNVYITPFNHIIMLIDEIRIDGFRCLCNISIILDKKVTLIVGENDSGKSSVIDCINIFTGDYQIEPDDFNFNKDKITIKLVTEEFEFIKYYEKENFPNETFTIKPTEQFISSNKTFLENSEEPSSETDKIRIKDLAKLFGLTVRSNSRIDRMKTQLIEKFDEEDLMIEDGTFPELNLIQLDGKQFENIEDFFNEVFLKDKQHEIWNESISEGKTIKNFIDDKLKEYSVKIGKDLEERGIKEKIKQYITNLTEIKVDPSFEPRSLNISSKVKFLENEKEISVDKKGDGTKRRISIALLEYKVESEVTSCESKLYILDEPDTHLHVKAQLELFNILKELSQKSCQVILTTHSPFLINATKPKQIRLLFQPESNLTKIKYLKNEPETSDRILRKLGIENIYLYFAKKIILVEGETEEAFLPRIYEKINDTTLNNDLIKIINTRGITNIPGFAKALSELIDPTCICILKDNDSSENSLELINNLNIPEDRQFSIGEKEFEDAFDDDTLFNAWKKYIEECGKDISRSKWTIENIAELREKCSSSSDGKFSSKLKSLNEGSGKKFTKILLGQALGNYCDNTNIPEKFNELMMKLKEE